MLKEYLLSQSGIKRDKIEIKILLKNCQVMIVYSKNSTIDSLHNGPVKMVNTALTLPSPALVSWPSETWEFIRKTGVSAEDIKCVKNNRFGQTPSFDET